MESAELGKESDSSLVEMHSGFPTVMVQGTVRCIFSTARPLTRGLGACPLNEPPVVLILWRRQHRLRFDVLLGCGQSLVVP